jgi:hypothetical protein
MNRGTTFVFEAKDGSQVLVIQHSDGSLHVATRERDWHSWGPPLEEKRREP